MSTSPKIRVQGLWKHFGATVALQDVNLDIEENAFVTLVGASGCGKSTLLRTLAGLEHRSAGTLLCDVQPIEGPGADRAMVFQHYSLYPWLTVLENIRFSRQLKVHTQDRTAADVEAAAGRADALLRLMGLTHVARHYPSQLSGGMQQRVAIARALAMKPRLMLFDEVTSALDPELVHEVLMLMASLAKEGMTMLLVTHEMSFARDVSSRVLFFDRGVIGEQGAPSKVLRDPESPRLRQFLHSILHDDLSQAGAAKGLIQ